MRKLRPRSPWQRPRKSTWLLLVPYLRRLRSRYGAEGDEARELRSRQLDRIAPSA